MGAHARFMEMSPIPGSDFERDYGFIDYKDKVVLDIGADYGTTAAFFLRRGAAGVIAVEGDEAFFSALEENVREVSDVIAVKCLVSGPSDFENLIRTYRPDILKVDIEGSELHLLDVDDRTLLKVPEYVMEIHTEELCEKFRDKFQRLGYTITRVNDVAPGVRSIHAIPTQLHFNIKKRSMGIS